MNTFETLMKEMKKQRDLQLKSHKRKGEILVEFNEDGGVYKYWQWCYTHGRYEKAGWLQ